MRVFEYNGVMCADSREAAEILQVRHGNLMRTVNVLIEKETDLQSEFHSVVSSGKKVSHILMTEKGCRQLAKYKLNNKTGNKQTAKQFLLACENSFGKKETAEMPETNPAPELKKTTAIQTIQPEIHAGADSFTEFDGIRLQNIELNGQKVLTTAQLAEAYGTIGKTVKQNFNNNKSHYIEGKHFYCLIGDELKQFKSLVENFDLADKYAPKLYLWTKRGALLHAKSLNTDEAWDVYDKLVEFYFSYKETQLTDSMPSFMIEDPVKRIDRWMEEAQKTKALLLQVQEQEHQLTMQTKQITMQTEKIEKQEKTIAVQAEKIETQTNQIAVQEKTIEEQKPKADYCDTVLSAEGFVTPTMIAKDYGRSAQWLNNYLHKKKIQFKKNGVWYLYQPYAIRGYAMTKTVSKPDRNGIMRTYTHTNWNQEGRMFIYELLKADGIFPVSEQKTDEKQLTLANE